ncbi:hypothetical protein RHS01_09551 [Rhizoctonia solani]|uniref:Uncharacterized protein n=1 Tax=Rhizoctonia solani TaxID=456999 RepID=A0A8H7LXX9_9AGAM|nr:hypothetical protein RHS01_09551 [Rhizoctonia solani]
MTNLPFLPQPNPFTTVPSSPHPHPYISTPPRDTHQNIHPNLVAPPPTSDLLPLRIQAKIRYAQTLGYGEHDPSTKRVPQDPCAS